MRPLAPLLLVFAAAAQAQSTATLRGIDVYRSERFTSQAATERFGEKLRLYVTLKNERRPALDEKAEKVRRDIEAEAAKIPGLKRVELTVSEYFTSVDHAMYATFDVVDEADRQRLNFAPEGKKSITDPDGLTAVWKEYYDLGSALARRGQMPVDRPDCPGFYCLWGGVTPELEALQSKLVAGATLREAELRKVLSDDPDGEKRAAALFVLSYGNRGERVVEACLGSLRDRSPSVRGAALQILADVANHHRDLRIDVERIMPLLDDPSGSVRGKAMGLLVPMTDDAERRGKLLAAGPRLVALLKLKQPESRDLAFTLLGLISHQKYGRDELTQWEAWAARAAAGKDR